ncbi:MAG: hypothetical protein ACK4QW_17415 [Alphaproteobacteria bacterium]
MTAAARRGANAEPFIGAGFIALPHLFAGEEIGWLAEEARGLALLFGPEADALVAPDAPRGTVFAPHRGQRGFLDLALHPRLATAAGFGTATRLHQTRLWPGGRRPVPPGSWCDGAAWRRLDGIDPAGALTAVVFLEDAGTGAGLRVWPAGAVPDNREPGVTVRSPSALLSLPAGSVVLIEAAASYAPVDGRVAPAPSLFFAGLVPAEPPRAEGRRRAPFVVELPVAPPLGDDCLWPVPYFVAG